MVSKKKKYFLNISSILTYEENDRPELLNQCKPQLFKFRMTLKELLKKTTKNDNLTAVSLFVGVVPLGQRTDEKMICSCATPVNLIPISYPDFFVPINKQP